MVLPVLPLAMPLAIALTGLFDGTRAGVCNDVPEEVTVQTTECKPVTRERTAHRQVTKWKTSYRNVVKLDRETRLVNRSMFVEYVLPIEDFYLQARDVIIEEVRETLRSGFSHPSKPTLAAEICDFSGDQDHNREAVVMWGRTQAGKSTMTCQLRASSDRPCAEIGDGSGDSMTWTPELWHTLIGLLLDTPGIDDTKLRFTKEEAGRRVAVAVAQTNVTRVKFLVFDSMGNDGMQLRDTLASLHVAFGARALESAVVVASKVNLIPAAAGVKREHLLRQVMEEQGLTELVPWHGPELNETDLAALRASLSQVPSVPTTDLADLWMRQRELAQKFFDSQEKKIKEIFVEVEEQHVVEREEQEPYESPYVELEPYIEKYDAVDCYPVTKKSVVKARKCHT